ncbi:MAG: hypothetical protein LBV51_01860, partial [Acholeplasmatales bacterium]|nr:hypothetical protein [Acholeplasmatales bacterium]
MEKNKKVVVFTSILATLLFLVASLFLILWLTKSNTPPNDTVDDKYVTNVVLLEPSPTLKSTYNISEPFDFNGNYLIVDYSNNTRETIPLEASLIDGYDRLTSAKGQFKIIVHYQGLTILGKTTYLVNSALVSSVEISSSS